MKVGIYDVYDGKKMPHQMIYESILSYNDIQYELLSIKDNNFWQKAKEVDILMYKWYNNDDQHQLAEILRPIFDSLHINFFPNSETCWHYDDKIKQYYLLENHGMQPVPTFIFFNRDKAFEFIEEAAFPLVAKLKKGAGSSNVMLINDINKARKYIIKAFSAKGLSANYFGSFHHLCKTLDFDIKKIGEFYLKKLYRYLQGRDSGYWARHKNYVLFQQYLPGNNYDTRVTTVGNRVHAFRRFVRPNDFRASGGSEWDLDPDKIDKTMLKIALYFSQKMKFQTMAYDFIYDANKIPRIVEISYLFGQPGYPDFMNGYWDENLNWIPGRFWPQHFELMDVLKVPNLKCPVIEIPIEWKKNNII